MWRNIHNLSQLSSQLRNRRTKLSNIFHRPYPSFGTSPEHLKHPPSQNHLKTAQTGEPLQFECKLPIPSSILIQTFSSTFPTIYTSYPYPKIRPVTPPSHSTIFNFLFCSWSSLARFREFQDKVGIGKASLHFKEAVQVIISLWNILHCKARLQLNRYIHGVLSPLLGIVSFRFLKKTCHNHGPEHAHMFRFHLYFVCLENFMSEHG